MSGIEPAIKAQYSIFFLPDDWVDFKQMAEYYLDVAVHLRISNVASRFRKRKFEKSRSDMLRIRNIQKRLFIGLACELLLKARYLKEGYGINSRKNDNNRYVWELYKVADVNIRDYETDHTVTMNPLLDLLQRGPRFSEQHQQDILNGFRIAKVYRNKEAHIVTRGHMFEDEDYTDIEKALVLFYQEAFEEKLKIQFSVKYREKPIFKTYH